MVLARDKSPIPLTVIGGYLGAGKTTLLNNILLQQDMPRCTIIVNDFGTLNIDADLIASHEGQTMRLENGCICCSLADSLLAALFKIVKNQPSPERIIIEASGVSNPGKIADIARLSPSLKLDGVVVLVDAENIQEQIADPYVGDMVERQLQEADLFILNKLDQLDVKQQSNINLWLEQYTHGAPTIETSHANVSVEMLFNLGDTSRLSKPDAKFNNQQHQQAIRSWSFKTDKKFDRDRLIKVLKALPETIVRIKGFVKLQDSPDKFHVLQLAGKKWSFTEAHRQHDNSQLVVIGHSGLPEHNELHYLFSTALISAVFRYESA